MAEKPATNPFQRALRKALIPPDAELLTVEDCARVTRRHIMRIYDDIRAGRLEAVRFGKEGSKRPSIRVRRSALEAFISSLEVKA